MGEGICFGFNTRKRQYVAGIRKEHGIGARLTSVWYVEEIANLTRTSAFNKSRLEAFSAVVGSDLHYIAFIALEGNDTALFVLDTENDSIRRLGKAPLPPPLTPKEQEYANEHPGTLEGPWDWMASFRDGYMDLDPGIVVFQDSHLLKVSYGDDSAAGRAPQRKVITYDLGRD